jgi:hypothetical protein
LYFSERNKLEREFQQLIARENNFSGISNETEYFISDIEFAESEINARFDMLALRWLASERKNSNNFCPVLIEVKYGDGALDGTAGILKHLQDMDKLVSDKNKYENLLSMMKNQFNQLDELGLLKFNRSKNYGSIEFDGKQKPELVFILANHNPRSTKLKTILNDPEIKEYAKSTKFDLRFYVSCFAGYALHSGNMFTLDQFLDLLNR